ncbi:hypothetical protein BKA70DRAFT_370109 [Coprinopsis sp. MPI-PUGE-AT-0042]|nr:hypothetical protein BKA70DRAFT_370109 [Coprinopsis sp. MPI-PUGE-AT-0042]
MLSFNHPRPCPYIRLLRFTPNVLDTGAVKPFLRQLAEMNLTEARVAQGICIEISPRRQLPSPWSLHQRIDRALPTDASHAREHCHIKVTNGPWSVDHSWLFRNHCEQSLPTWEKLNFFANIQIASCKKSAIPPFSCFKPARPSQGTMSPNTQTTPRRTCSG